MERARRMADAKAWKIDEHRAPSPRAYLHLVNRWIRKVTRQILAAIGIAATADAEPDAVSQQIEAAQIRRNLAALKLVELTPPEIEGANKPAARQSMRTARKQVISAGVSRKRFSERLGLDVEELIGIDVAPTLAEQAALRAWAKEGTDLITTVGQEIVAGLDEHIADAARRGVLTSDLRQIVADRLGVGQRHAQLIARTEIARLNSQITESTQKAAGITRYKWRSSRDQRTRERHRELDGTIQEWAHPPEGAGPYGEPAHPGQSPNCRCVAIPVVDLDGIEADEPKPDGGWQGPVAPGRTTEPRTTPKPRAPKPVDADFDLWTAPGAAPAPGLRTLPTAPVTPPPAGRRLVPGMEVSLDAARFATPEQQRAAFLDNWVHGSKSKGAIAMKQAVQAELGVGGEVYQSRRFSILPGDVAAAQDAVRLQYDMTQASLRARGGSPIRLYRGITTEYAGQGAIESWTSDPKIAKRFAGPRGKVLTQLVSPDRVLAHSGGPGWKNGRFGEQSEWMILAPGATP